MFDIYTIGCTKVVAVVTDTCTTMQKAWPIVEDDFPWISCLPCQTHCPSLLLTDVAKLKEPTETIKEESIVVGWFTNHQKPLAILRDTQYTQWECTLARQCSVSRASLHWHWQ